MSVEFTAEEGKVNGISPFIVQARRIIIGRAYMDKNGNNTFDEDDEPISGAKIQMGPVNTQSEEDGSFSVSSLPAGNYRIKASPAMYKGFHLSLVNDRINIPEAGTIEIEIPYQK